MPFAAPVIDKCVLVNETVRMSDGRWGAWISSIDGRKCIMLHGGRWEVPKKIVWDPDAPPVLEPWPEQLTQVNQACPRFLRLDALFVNHNGNGHAFFQLNTFMVTAANYNLTAIAEYNVDCGVGCNRHGLSRTNEYFFGDYFSRNKRHIAKNSTILELNKPSLWPGAIATQMARVREQHLCNVVLDVHQSTMKSGLIPSEVNYSTPGFRAAFNSQHGRIERLRRREEQARNSSVDALARRHGAAADARPVRIAVHIRRGEVYRNALDPGGNWARAHQFNRLSPVSTYTAIVREVVDSVKSACFDDLAAPPIEVIFAAENATVLEPGRSISIPDLGVGDAIVHADTFPGVTFIALASDEVLEAFEDLCFSDIVIGSRSGFSALAAYLCKAPLFLAMPFWHSYEFVPNIVVMRERSESTRTGQFTKFTSLTSKHTPVTNRYDIRAALFRQKLTREPWCARGISRGS